MADFHVSARKVRYHEDAADLFHHLGGTSASDSVLLESADIDSKKNTTSMAVLQAAVRVTCMGQTVTATPLTSTGHAMVARLQEHFGTSGTEFSFHRSELHDERQRLLDINNAEILRLLQWEAGYSGVQLPLLAGGFAFDYMETFEQLPPVPVGDNSYPDYQFVVAETVLVTDHLKRSAVIEGVSIDPSELEDRLDSLVATIDSHETVEEGPATTATNEILTVRADISDVDFCQSVSALQDNIQAGDIYQVVPARSFSAPCESAYAAYRHLRTINPSPYMFYVRGITPISCNSNKTYELIGASPESNLKFDSRTREIQLYPIAGTRPRGRNPDGSINHELDIRAELDMRTNVKEIAEHTMLVDLARNDLARVSLPTTRRVAELLQVDRYSQVMHLVSRVVATLDPEFDAIDAYRACMNMGTLTGAPKLRAIELLRGVEAKRRGSYGGAVGYLQGDGSMDTCIVIRSAFIQDGVAVVQAGAGVVRDSIPQSEANETLHKAYAVLHAIALAAGKDLEVIR